MTSHHQHSVRERNRIACNAGEIAFTGRPCHDPSAIDQTLSRRIRPNYRDSYSPAWRFRLAEETAQMPYAPWNSGREGPPVNPRAWIIAPHAISDRRMRPKPAGAKPRNAYSREIRYRRAGSRQCCADERLRLIFTLLHPALRGPGATLAAPHYAACHEEIAMRSRTPATWRNVCAGKGR